MSFVNGQIFETGIDIKTEVLHEFDMNSFITDFLNIFPPEVP